jgi:alkylhydroperoxidase/carboxymuconolactone decarboxylase family protein YurZ
MNKSMVYKSFVDMEQKTYIDGELPKKQKEFIAIGISVVKNCECLNPQNDWTKF